MAYTANVPSRMRIAERCDNRTNDIIDVRNYIKSKEGLPDSNATVIQPLTPEAIFYSIEDVAKLTGWSVKVVQRLFNKSEFPATNIGKRKLVEAHALVAFFSVRRNRDSVRDWE